MATDLNADLAMVEIIFSDKTGTLTNNEMFFKKACVGTNWVHDEYKSPGKLYEKIKASQHSKSHSASKQERSAKSNPTELDQELLTDTMTFLLTLALCHQAKPKSKIMPDDENSESQSESDEEDTDPELHEDFQDASQIGNDTNAIIPPEPTDVQEYQAESPDEIALVAAARDNQFVVTAATDHHIELDVFGVHHRFLIEATIEFTPDRKRMSQVVRIPHSFSKQFPWYYPENTCLLLAKGADSYMFKRMNVGKTSQEIEYLQSVKSQMNQRVDEFAVEGLRTLILCYKILNDDQASEWLKEWRKAKVATQNKELKEEQAANKLECDLELIGSTAIEDKLQEFVPETISFFMKAGLKMWMLTGDKRQTAKNIAKTTGLFNDHTIVMELDTTTDDKSALATRENTPLKLQTIMDHINNHIDLNNKCEIALVVDGDALNYAMDKSNIPMFLSIVSKCKTAICCRATPLNKASLVELMKKKFQMVGLAIGDGANDVTMIQKAKVGVGISGKEGSQAKQASDYCLQRFYHLKRLLFVHGHYSFVRTALFVQYSFYKNLLLTFLQVFFAFYCLYSGQTIVDSWMLTLYNMIFTLLPPFVMGLFDKDMEERLLMDNPEFYKQVQRESVFNVWTFVIWLSQAFYHSTVIFFFSFYVCYYNGILNDMRTDGIWMFAIVMSSMGFLVVNAKAMLEMSYHTWITYFCVGLSIFVYYAFLFCYSGVKTVSGAANMYFVAYHVFGTGNFWLLHLLCITTCLAPDFTFKIVKKYFFPYPWETKRREFLNKKMLASYLVKGRRSKSKRNIRASNAELKAAATLNELKSV
ncbi:phospholipid-transporting ATPase [Acrasis kona]|uniref:Phospholipid-transporting ATPase n=1 Tax=Acrasis kona TaxID=1008807 RepID=A0AAW2Z3P0_9EUKA